VAVQELRFGDNDTLSALVATLVDADYLFLTTDVDALYTSNPKVRGGKGSVKAARPAA
jgi:glutamate 5-kinase